MDQCRLTRPEMMGKTAQTQTRKEEGKSRDTQKTWGVGAATCSRKLKENMSTQIRRVNLSFKTTREVH